jgi:pimeloyl-ACP methyl ester carboxylesterase
LAVGHPSAGPDPSDVGLSLPGHGDSDPAVGGYAPGRDLAPFVAGFLDVLGVGSLDLVGDSVGGAVELRLALADPERVRTLTLVASAGLGREVNPLLALAAAMLFAQPWRMPAEFVTEQHAQGCRAGHLEAATAMARALFDVNGQREVLRSTNSTSCRCRAWSSGARVTTCYLPTRLRLRWTACPQGGCRCSLTADTCPTWSAPTGSPRCSASFSPSTNTPATGRIAHPYPPSAFRGLPARATAETR